MFSCEYSEIFKNSLFHKTLLVAASEHMFTSQKWLAYSLLAVLLLLWPLTSNDSSI